jgi:purine-nucleoside/S-methyl-5'-thioadenosine phosphorylase / adenosine deaminase
MIRREKEGIILYSWSSLDRLGINAFTSVGLNTALHAAGNASQQEIIQNRSLLSCAAGLNPEEWICGNQVHSAHSYSATAADIGRGALSATDAIQNTDALILTEAGLQGMIFTADCLPLILYDRKQNMGALVHAGWRGAASGIVPIVLEKMIKNLGSDVEDILAAAGPSIGSCCYQVDLPVYEAMTETYPETEAAFTPDGTDHWRLSLEKAVFQQLYTMGIKEEQCESSELCSCCNKELSSWRREGAGAGRMASCLCL